MERLIIKTSDMYEVVWYLCASQSIEVTSIEVIPRTKNVLCQFALSGADLDELQTQYLQDNACVNIKTFRKVLQQVQSLVNEAKKKAKLQGGQA